MKVSAKCAVAVGQQHPSGSCALTCSSSIRLALIAVDTPRPISIMGFQLGDTVPPEPPPTQRQQNLFGHASLSIDTRA